MPMLFVVDPVHPVALVTSLEFPYRAAASSRRSAALPPLSPPLPASPPRALCIGILRALTRAPEPEIEPAGEPRHRSPSAAAVGLRAPPSPLLSRLRTFSAIGSRSDASPARLTRKPPQPLDLDPTYLDLVNLKDQMATREGGVNRSQ
jgi:hypothetical protein